MTKNPAFGFHYLDQTLQHPHWLITISNFEKMKYFFFDLEFHVLPRVFMCGLG